MAKTIAYKKCYFIRANCYYHLPKFYGAWAIKGPFSIFTGRLFFGGQIMVQVLRFLALLLVGAILASCTMVKSDIARFSNLSQGDSGTFFMVPLKTQEGSIEYQTYANSVANKLKEKGFKRVDDLSNADYAVTIGYGISGQSEVSGSTPIYGQTGGGTTYHSGTASSYGYGRSGYGMYSGTSYTPPTYGVVGSSSYNYTKHHRYFYLKMYDAKKSNEEKLVSVYEGTVKSAGKSAHFSTVSSVLLRRYLRIFSVPERSR